MRYQVFLKEHNQASFLNLKELETELQFTYLHQLDVLDKEEKMLQKEQQISDEAVKNGIKYRKLIESAYIPKVSIRWISEKVGYGLFTEEDLQENVYVGEYVGLIRKNDDHTQFNHYLYSYPVLDFIGRNYVIDASKGNLTRFANHSFEPNLQPVYAYFSGFYHCIFTTLRPILKGTQLTYNYGKKYWYIRGTPTTL